MLKLSINEIYSLLINSNGISTDSRNIIKGSLFFSFKGENFDGNKYAQTAIEKGCKYAIVENKDVAVNNNFILVENCLTILQKLANYHRRKIGIPIIAITGTNGKTTSKELIKEVLSNKFTVQATKGNFNNHIGVPLTLLSFNNKTDIGIVEMGANHSGEIEKLCSITNPNYGIITNIGKAHIEGFGSFEAIIKAKSELYKYIFQTKGKLFLNSENKILLNLIEKEKINCYYYGNSNESLVSGKILYCNPYLSIEVTDRNNNLTSIIKTKLIGQYNFENILLAVTVGLAFGISLNDITTAINNYKPVNNRSQLTKTSTNTLFVDCYNANPTSMNAAINNFIAMPSENRTLIIGDMKELGDISKKEHLKIISLINKSSFENVFLVGEIFHSLKNLNYKTFITSEDLYKYISSHPINSNYILIKGSRSIKLEKVIELL